MNEKFNPVIEAAKSASMSAYAPYSNFRVGTAVLLDNGMIITGNNQENRSYPLGSCAERVAVNYARANFPDAKVEAIAIYSPDSENPIAPCGGCREVILEVVISQHSDIQVVMCGNNDRMDITTACELLPHAFILTP